MTKLVNSLHILQAIGGLFFGLFVAYVAYSNSFEGRPDLGLGRITLSIILVLYSGAQFLRLYATKITMLNFLSFPIIYVLFGLFWEYSSRGYIKNWAPATIIEANQQNYICLSILFGIGILGVWSTLKKCSRGT